MITNIVQNGKMVQLDLIAGEADHFEIEVQDRPNGKVLYVHANGITILRICQIQNITIR